MRHAQLSVIIDTAYMEEAERFDWLAAMDNGRVIAAASPAEMRSKAGAATLEETFIDLLPPEIGRCIKRSWSTPLDRG